MRSDWLFPWMSFLFAASMLMRVTLGCEIQSSRSWGENNLKLTSITMFLVQVIIIASAIACSNSVNTSTAWPRTVQPFFLSATKGQMTAEDAQYLARLPVVVINHKQGGTGRAEENQLSALSAVKHYNASCKTFFYINSQIDFPALKLHDEFVANGTWWLRDDKGKFVLHGEDHIFDVRVAAARSAWLATAEYALSQPYISGVFADKAGSFYSDSWTRSHLQMLEQLGSTAAAMKKHLIYNNAGIIGMAGQLFERWGENPDHDGLTVLDDMELLKNATAESNSGQYSLARAGGVRPGTGNGTSPEICGA